MSRIVVNSEDLRKTAKLMTTAWVEFRNVRTSLGSSEFDSLGAPPAIANQVQVGVGYVRAAILQGLDKLDPATAELNRRALWAELAGAYRQHRNAWDALFTPTVIRHMNEIAREEKAKYLATPSWERLGYEGDGIAEDGAFFDAILAVAGAAGIVRALIKDGAKDLAGPALRRLGKLLGRKGTEAAEREIQTALGLLTRAGTSKASQLVEFGRGLGWREVRTETGPIKFFDKNGVKRLVIKKGSARTAGSEFPHVEMRNAAGGRVDPWGDTVARGSPGNHTPIEWDLP